MRSKTLAEVVERTLGGESFDLCFADFLDEFFSCPTESALSEEPQRLSVAGSDNGRVRDAYLAAAAELLATEHGLRVPAWVEGEGRALHEPWFASNLSGLRAILLHESPWSFRSRNLFVSENALTRV